MCLYLWQVNITGKSNLESKMKPESPKIHAGIALAFILLGIMVMLLAIFAGAVFSWLWILVWIACFLTSAYFFKTDRTNP